MNRPHWAGLPAVVAVLLLSVALAGCADAVEVPGSVDPDAQAPTPAESASSSATAAPSEAPTATPEPTPSPAVIPTACLSLGEIDCQRAAGLAKLALLPHETQVVYIQAGPFACKDGEARCAPTLAARPEGDVVIELADGTGLSIHLKDQAGAVQTTRNAAPGGPFDPSSPAGIEEGPQDFTLGHCGIFSGIDLDAAWWDPVGFVDMDSGDAINATAGTFTLVDPTHATFEAPSGFVLQLQRREGAKLLPLCM